MSLSEKYRPKTFSDLVIPNDTLRIKLEQWIANSKLDGHIILHGLPGLGKTSTINVMLKEMNIADYKIVNVSNQTGIDDMRKLIDYASVPPIVSSFKVIILEEFERASPQAQDSLKYTLDTYGSWCHFIFTTNNINNISDAIQSRSQIFTYTTLPLKSFTERIFDILIKENISIDNQDSILKIIENCYPDLRATLNTIEQHINGSNINSIIDHTFYSASTYQNIIKSALTDSILNTKKMIGSQMTDELYEPFYKYMYTNLEEFSTNQDKWDFIIIKIAEYLIKHETCAYPCINLMSCLIEIKNILNNK